MIGGIINVLIGLALIFIFFGPKFNQWPKTDHFKFNGSPKEYIDTFRYYKYFFLYLSIYSIIVSILSFSSTINSWEILTSIFGAHNEFLNVFEEGSFTFVSIFIILIMSHEKVKDYDTRLRSKLLEFARIPREVEDLKRHLIGNIRRFEPTEFCFEEVFKNLIDKCPSHFWRMKHAEVKQKLADDSFKWVTLALDYKILKALYLINVLDNIGCQSKNMADLNDRKNWLYRRANEMPSISKFDTPDIYSDRDQEIDKLITFIYECICKVTVRQYTTNEKRYYVLSKYGFAPIYLDNFRIKFVQPLFQIIVGVFIASFISVALFLFARDIFGVPVYSGDRWLVSSRLWSWVIGSTICYIVSIFFGYIIESISHDVEDDPSTVTYLVAIVLSTFGAYSYYFFTREVKTGHIPMVLSFGVVAYFVVASLSDLSQTSKIGVFKYALRMGLINSAIQSVFSLLIQISFSGFAVDNIAKILTSVGYGALNGLLIGFIITYSIQSIIRKQLSFAARKAPRKSLIAKIAGEFNGEQVDFVIKNISRSGVMVNGKYIPDIGEVVRLKIQNVITTASVVWKKGKLAGLKFIREDKNLPKIHRHIRHRFGDYYA